MARHIPDSKQGRVSMSQPISRVVKPMTQWTILIGVEMRRCQDSEWLLPLLKRRAIVLVKVVVATKIGGRDPRVQETNKHHYGENSQPLFHIELASAPIYEKIGPNCGNNIAFLMAHTFPEVSQEAWPGTAVNLPQTPISMIRFRKAQMIRALAGICTELPRKDWLLLDRGGIGRPSPFILKLSLGRRQKNDYSHDRCCNVFSPRLRDRPRRLEELSVSRR